MSRLFMVFTIAMTVVISSSASTSALTHEGEGKQSIHLKDGRLFVNDELVNKGFSVNSDSFRYLFFYVPARGLFIISNAPFDGATERGAFKGSSLSFDVADLKVRIDSATQVLDVESAPVWVKFDPSFNLNVKSVIFGYGDKESAPYDWPNQIKQN